MDTEPQINYEDVLADLENDRAALDAMIAYIKAKKLGHSTSASQVTGVDAAVRSMPLGSPSTLTGGNVGIAGGSLRRGIASDAFFGLGIVDAAKKYLGMTRRPQSSKEIATALVQGGFHTTAKDFYNTVFGVLSREWKNNGEIVKVNKEWGMAEWYPGLRRGTKTSKGPIEEALDTIPGPNVEGA